MSTFATIARSTVYSPGAHACNDAWILGAVSERLRELGWVAVGALTEEQIEHGEELPDADLVLNMAQGAAASQRLRTRPGRARLVNTPLAVLDCHRARAVARLSAPALPFVPSFVVHHGDDLEPARAWLTAKGYRHAWVKRGDVHAVSAEDVVRTSSSELGATVERMLARLPRPVVVQPHLEGPVLKFYGIDGGWLRWLFAEPPGEPPPPSDFVDGPLRDAVFGVASRLGLEVFGGDAALGPSGKPVLIDINDWPSFAPFRDEAAAAIASYLHRSAARPATPKRLRAAPSKSRESTT